MRNWNQALEWKIADRFPKLSESDFNMKTNLAIVIKPNAMIKYTGHEKIFRWFAQY